MYSIKYKLAYCKSSAVYFCIYEHVRVCIIIRMWNVFGMYSNRICRVDYTYFIRNYTYSNRISAGVFIRIFIRICIRILYVLLYVFIYVRLYGTCVFICKACIEFFTVFMIFFYAIMCLVVPRLNGTA